MKLYTGARPSAESTFNLWAKYLLKGCGFQSLWLTFLLYQCIRLYLTCWTFIFGVSSIAFYCYAISNYLFKASGLSRSLIASAFKDGELVRPSYSLNLKLSRLYLIWPTPVCLKGNLDVIGYRNLLFDSMDEGPS